MAIQYSSGCGKASLKVDFPCAHTGTPIPADSEVLARQGRRVMVYRRTAQGEFDLFVAERGLPYAGFVLAVETKCPEEEENPTPHNP